MGASRSSRRERVATAAALVLVLAGLAGCEGTASLSPSERVFFSVDDIVIGTGQTPLPGDIVRIRYVAWLWDQDGPDNKGQRVDGSENFEFVLEVTQTLPAFTQGIGNMRVGGLRRMQVPPEYGVGSEARGNIPPNSTLVIEVELLEVRLVVTDSAPFQIIDLLEGDGQVAADGYVLTVLYDGHLYDADRPDGKGRLFERNQEVGISFPLGLGEVLEGWDVGLQGMRENGMRRLIIPPEMAYGAQGRRPRIPPNATLLFDVTLRRVQIP